MSNKQAKTPPHTIFLQWFGDADPEIDGPEPQSEVTWSEDQIFESDIEYIKKQQVTARVSALLVTLEIIANNARHQPGWFAGKVQFMAAEALNEWRQSNP